MLVLMTSIICFGAVSAYFSLREPANETVQSTASPVILTVTAEEPTYAVPNGPVEVSLAEGSASIEAAKTTPAVASKPLPVSKPAPAAAAKPAPVVASKPVPVSKPAPAAVAKPAPVVASKPVPVSKPAPAAVAKAAPVKAGPNAGGKESLQVPSVAVTQPPESQSSAPSGPQKVYTSQTPTPVKAVTAAPLVPPKVVVLLATKDKAWVKIDDHRTVIVQKGEELPGFGKLLETGARSVKFEKGSVPVTSE
jgi:hypothetical protein